MVGKHKKLSANPLLTLVVRTSVTYACMSDELNNNKRFVCVKMEGESADDSSLPEETSREEDKMRGNRKISGSDAIDGNEVVVYEIMQIKVLFGMM